MEWLALVLFALVICVLLFGYPVAFSLGGTALLFAFVGVIFGFFELSFLEAMPSRILGIMTNETLVAVPLFVFMGVMLERSGIAEKLLETMGELFGRVRGGMGISVMLVGMLLAASTGIVGATVVTMTLLSLPTMLKQGYSPAISSGAIAASGTLGQIIPPSIVLILLGDVISSAYQQAQLRQGVFSPETVTVGDLFAGALLPGLVLVGIYITYLLLMAWFKPESMPAYQIDRSVEQKHLWFRVLTVLIPPLLLIVAVLGSILTGIATPTEAAAVGAVGAMILAISYKKFDLPRLQDVMQRTARISSMVFLILIGASVFSLVFRGLGGDDLVHSLLVNLPGGKWGALLAVMIVMFLLGFVLDFIEITFVVVPIVGPILLAMDIDPIWLGILIAVNLQTSFLTPPFGFALFYLRGVAPPEFKTTDLYRGVMPFVGIQMLMLLILCIWPELATWLPKKLFG
ncbi:MAG: TRAP transporter large permease subunit [Gammaproteobacteria bacterium]|nr:TRAP transporter large permease subunit [Gammaproteobacteria bacterium]NNM13004.1 TRAP transporter large permease subunit [Gammaproteobacteria bacterium]